MLIPVHIIHITNVVTITFYNVKTVVNNPLIFCSKVIMSKEPKKFFEENMHIPSFSCAMSHIWKSIHRHRGIDLTGRAHFVIIF